jgi:three-Cys-motif partner protein
MRHANSKHDVVAVLVTDRRELEPVDAGLIALQDPESGRCEVVPGDVNVELPRLIAQMSRRSPTFVFLDPEGIEPKWSTIQAIAPWQTELLINFPLGMAIKRNLNSAKVTDYFGTEDWRAVFGDGGSEAGRRLLDFYKERLKGLGWKHTTDADPEIAATGGQRLYHLIFVSKVEAGSRIMKWVHQQPDARGQLRFKF